MTLQIPFSTQTVFNTLDKALNFISNNLNSTYPTFINAINGLSPYSFDKTFTNVKSHLFKPWNSSNIIDQALICKACFTAYEVTQNQFYLFIANSSLLAIKNYFHIDNLNDLNSSSVIYHNFLTIALNNIYDIGSQSSDSYLNFGNFNSVVSFSNGIGTLSDANIAIITKVCDNNSSELKSKFLYSTLLTGTEYSVDYFVTNFNLENVNYRIDGTTFNVLQTTSESAGKIVLNNTSFTGNLKVTYGSYLNNIISNNNNNSLDSNYQLCTYPVLLKAHQSSTRVYLQTVSQALYLLYDVFTLASSYYSILTNYGYTESSTVWSNAALAVKNTILNVLGYSVQTYFLKSSFLNEIYKYPGLRLTVNGSIDQTVISNTLTLTREQTITALKQYTKLSIIAATSNFPVTLTNVISQSNFNSNSTITIQIASNITNVLDLKGSTLASYSDSSQDYIAQIVVSNDSNINNFSLSANDFLSFDTANMTFNVANRNNTATLNVTNDATLTQSFIQTSFTNLNNQIIQPVALQLVFNSGTDGAAITTLNNCNFTNKTPYIYYYASGQVNLIITDNASNTYYVSLPDTNGIWQKIQLNFTAFTVIDIKIQNITTTATLQLWYIGKDPVSLPINTQVYNVAISDYNNTVHSTWIGDYKLSNNNVDNLTYKNLMPFSTQITRNGSTILESSINQDIFNVSNQSPYHFYLFGNTVIASQQLTFINDCITDFLKQSSTQLQGVAIPGYLSPIESNFTNFNNNNYNNFVYSGFNHDFNSFYNLCITVEKIARYLLLNSSDINSKAVVLNFLKLCLKYYVDINQPPTLINSDATLSSLYKEPGNNAIIGRIAIYANIAGITPDTCNAVIQACYNFAINEIVTDTNNTMFGSFSNSQNTVNINGTNYKHYVNYWHSETILFLSEILNYRNKLNYLPQSNIIQFPNIVPAFIDNMKLGKFENNTVKFSDSEQTIILNNLSNGAELTLKYNLIHASELATLTAFYQQQAQKVNYFQLPSAIWKHPTIIQNVINPSNSFWVFKDKLSFEVRVADTNKGLWNLNINLTQVLRRVLNPVDEIQQPDFDNINTSVQYYSLNDDFYKCKKFRVTIKKITNDSTQIFQINVFGEIGGFTTTHEPGGYYIITLSCRGNANGSCSDNQTQYYITTDSEDHVLESINIINVQPI